MIENIKSRMSLTYLDALTSVVSQYIAEAEIEGDKEAYEKMLKVKMGLGVVESLIEDEQILK